MDPIPTGYISLLEAFRKWCAFKCRPAGEQPEDRSKWQEWYTENSRLTDEAADEFEKALLDEDLEACVYGLQQNRTFRITPSDIEQSCFFGRLFFSETIHALGDEPLQRHQGQVPLVAATAFERWYRKKTGEHLGGRAEVPPPYSASDQRALLPNAALIQGWMREGYPTELPASPYVTLTEAATWRLDGVSLTPKDWNRALLRIQLRARTTDDLWLRSYPGAAERPHGIVLNEATRELVKHSRDWWTLILKSFEQQVSATAISVLQDVISNGGEVLARRTGAVSATPLELHELARPIRFDPSSNALLFDENRAKELSSTFLPPDCDWTDIAVATELVRSLGTNSPVKASDAPSPSPPIERGSEGVWAKATIDAEIASNGRITKQKFEELAREKGFNRDLARHLFETHAPAELRRGRGRPISKS